MHQLSTRQRAAEEDSALYRDQINYLFANSAFYRDKLGAAGFADAGAVGGLGAIAALPLTEKDELRTSRNRQAPIGAHLAVPASDIARIYSTSGTTGSPSFIPLTARDLEDWIEISCRSYGNSGIHAGQKIVTTYGAGPFVAGVTLDAFNALGLTHIPMGSGNSERLLTAVELLGPEAAALTPSYALHLTESARRRGLDLAHSAVRHLLVAGEPGGGEPAMRAQLEAAWGARVTEAMGIGDISVSLWGECEHQTGMHFSGQGLVHFELIEPESAQPITLADGAMGELVYTHLRQQAAPLLRFRSRDHVRIEISPCPCGRTAPRVRCVGRTDDMLIVRGVNVFPTAVREVVSEFAPEVSGMVEIRPRVRGVKQTPPLPIIVELSPGTQASPELAERISRHIREVLVFSPRIELVKAGALPRSEYKTKLVEWPAGKT